MNKQSKYNIGEVAFRIEQAAKAAKSDRVFNILCSVSAKLAAQGQPFAPKMNDAEMTIVKMYLED